MLLIKKDFTQKDTLVILNTTGYHYEMVTLTLSTLKCSFCQGCVFVARLVISLWCPLGRHLLTGINFNTSMDK